MIFYIIAFVLTCLLQYWLSGRKSRIPGLILPALNLLLSIVMILSFAAYSFGGASYGVSIVTAENGVVVQDEDGSILSVSSFPDEIDIASKDESTAAKNTLQPTPPPDFSEESDSSANDARQVTPPPAAADGSTSIGIIGGADGPTAIFVTGDSDILALVFVFLFNNIPTAVYLLIYAIKRRQLKRSNVDKTLIQDL